MPRLRFLQVNLLRLVLAVCLVILSSCGGGDTTVQSASTPQAAAATPGITLFAGSLGGAGTDDGLPGRLSLPWSIAAGPDGSMYIADYLNCNIRKLTNDGLSLFLGARSCFSYKPDGEAISSGFTTSYRQMFSDGLGYLYYVKQVPPSPLGSSPSRPLIRVSPDGSQVDMPIRIAEFGYVVGTDGRGKFYESVSSQDGSFTIYAHDVTGRKTVHTSGVYASSDFAVTSDGVIYALNQFDSVIYRVSQDGVVSIFAGSGRIGSGDGLGASASFKYPSGIAVDSLGNVFVSDSGNYTIRKISPDGAVSTIAGTAGVRGIANGEGLAATFSEPGALAVDQTGNLFVGDGVAIRRVSPDGVVSTAAGVPLEHNVATDGIGSSARFSSPRGLAKDAAGNIYVADSGNGIVRKIDPAANVTTHLGNPATQATSEDGVAATASLFRPAGIAFDAQGVTYVSDHDRIYEISPSGKLRVIVRVSTIGGVQIRIGSIAVTPNGYLYHIQHTRFGDFLIRTRLSDLRNESVSSAVPTASTVATDSLGNVFLASAAAVSRFAADAREVLAGPDSHFLGWRDGTREEARFNFPTALAVDSKGNIYVADSRNHVIRRITTTGMVTTVVGKPGVSGLSVGNLPGLIHEPQGLVVDSQDNLYVTTQNAVLKIKFP